MSQNFDLERFSQEFDRQMGKTTGGTQSSDYTPPKISTDGTGEISIEQQGGVEAGGFVNAPPVEDVLAHYGLLENSVHNEVESLNSTLHTLKTSLNGKPAELKKLSLASGLAAPAVESDPAFARKKIDSDQYATWLQAFSDNIHQTPNTLGFLREADALDQLAITQDNWPPPLGR